MKRKYESTQIIDDTLRAIYERARGNKVERHGLPSMRRFARKIGWTQYALYGRASELGLTKPRRQQWSEREIRFLTSLAHLTPRTIYEKFRQKGYKRTPTAIYQKLWELNIRSESQYYTARSLALCLGYQNGAKIISWIQRGWLKAERRGSDRANDNYLIHQDEIRKFILANPMEIDLRKVEQTWFFDIMFEGKVGISVSEALREPEAGSVSDAEIDESEVPDEAALISEVIAHGEYIGAP